MPTFHPRSRPREKAAARVAVCLVASLAILLLPRSAHAADIVVKESTRSVKETIDALAALLAKKGISVVARVDHAAGARAAGMDLPSSEVLIFGNPKLGTPLMQANPEIGLDLPMKVHAWQDSAGKVHVAYTSPAALAARHSIAGQENVLAAMAKALDGLTDAAAGLAKP